MIGNLPDPSYAANIAAIAGGFGLLGLLIIVLFAVTLLNRYAGKKQASIRQGKPASAKDGVMYQGLLPQSTMGLISSMSGQSFASSPSELFTVEKCVSGSVVEFHQHQHHQTRPATSSVTVIASGHENPALSLDEEAKDGSNSDEGENGYGPIQMIKVEKQDSTV